LFFFLRERFWGGVQYPWTPHKYATAYNSKYIITVLLNSDLIHNKIIIINKSFHHTLELGLKTVIQTYDLWWDPLRNHRHRLRRRTSLGAYGHPASLLYRFLSRSLHSAANHFRMAPTLKF